MLIASVPVLAWGQTTEQPGTTVQQGSAQPDSVQRPNKLQRLKQDITQRIQDKLNEPYDTTRNSGYWWRSMKHGKVDFNDSTMGYPKFVKFCYKAYKWGDKAFNSYDTSYVVSTGKNWKLQLKNQNWMDDFMCVIGDERARFTSGASSNIGVFLSFMAVSVGYSLDIDRIFGGKRTSEIAEFSFTCARFAAEAYIATNTGRMSTRLKTGGGNWQRHEKLRALRRKSMGGSATYFFNNRKYARAAAYCFSKYQRRSAGSALAGFSIINYDFKIDKDQLTPEQAYDFEQVGMGHIRYTDYCLKGGYAYNWVMNSKFLFNITATAGAGVKHIHSTETMASGNNGALIAGGSFALTYNHKRFFASLNGNANTSLYITGDFHFSYTIANITTVLGIRF